MKTTFELPDALVKQVELRARQDGRNLEDEIADLLRKGLAVADKDGETLAEPKLTRDEKTGLPLIVGGHPAKNEMTPEQISDLLLAQEVEWHNALGR